MSLILPWKCKIAWMESYNLVSFNRICGDLCETKLYNSFSNGSCCNQSQHRFPLQHSPPCCARASSYDGIIQPDVFKSRHRFLSGRAKCTSRCNRVTSFTSSLPFRDLFQYVCFLSVPLSCLSGTDTCVFPKYDRILNHDFLDYRYD